MERRPVSTAYLFGDINEESAERVRRAVEEGTADRLVINTTGGDVGCAFAIYDALAGRGERGQTPFLHAPAKAFASQRVLSQDMHPMKSRETAKWTSRTIAGARGQAWNRFFA
jgi:hypothetical protein